MIFSQENPHSRRVKSPEWVILRSNSSTGIRGFWGVSFTYPRQDSNLQP